ncbi:MAG TPA: hypothetical protein VLT87_10980 [Thermoanaerobaculia bacterium]|nr:hypothetical protein [Thermoanaerobaculia bacterium]
MAGEFVFLHPYLSIDGTDVSSQIQSVTFKEPIDVVEWVASQPSGTTYKSRLPGVNDVQMDVEASDDLTATTGLDAVLRGCRNRSVAVIFKPNGGTTSATNRKYTFNAMINDVPLGGAVGQQAKKSFQLMHTTGGLTVATSD